MATPLPPSSDFTSAATQAAAQTAYGNQRAFLAGLLGTDGEVATALGILGALGGAYIGKTAAYTLVLGDRGKMIAANSGTWTLSLLAAATASAGFSFMVLNRGAGVITIDPNGSEVINSAATMVLVPGAAAIVITNGTQWFALEIPGPAQVAATDATAGAILRVSVDGGSFGIGNLGTLTTIANLDSISVPSGFYAMRDSPTTLGTRPTDIGPLIWGIVEVQVFDSGTVHQRLWRNTALGTTNGYYKRSYNAGAWGAWDMTFMRSNLLGTVAQTGGVPTGSVIERGSNANGEYVKYADGTLICTRATLSAPNANTALGSIFRSADVAWTFPATFVNTTHLVVSGDVDDADSWLAVNTITTTGCNVRALAGATKAAALTCRASAIGRWF